MARASQTTLKEGGVVDRLGPDGKDDHGGKSAETDPKGSRPGRGARFAPPRSARASDAVRPVALVHLLTAASSSTTVPSRRPRSRSRGWRREERSGTTDGLKTETTSGTDWSKGRDRPTLNPRLDRPQGPGWLRHGRGRPGPTSGGVGGHVPRGHRRHGELGQGRRPCSLGARLGRLGPRGIRCRCATEVTSLLLGPKGGERGPRRRTVHPKVLVPCPLFTHCNPGPPPGTGFPKSLRKDDPTPGTDGVPSSTSYGRISP